MTTINDLPNEVLERVFNFANGVSLANSLGVCCKWRAVIKNQLRIVNLWRLCCVREIPEEMLLDLIGGFELGNSQFSNEPEDSTEDLLSIPLIKAYDLNIDWMYVYKTWYCTSKIRGQATICPFNAFPSIPIMCCKVSGSLVITGHRNGSVCAWEYQTGQLKRVVAQHLRIVTDLALIDLLKSGPYGDRSCLCYHHHVISISKDYTAIISPLVGKNNEEPEVQNRVIIVHHTRILERIKVFGNTFALSCLDNTISVWRVMVSNNPWDKAIVRRIKTIQGPPDILQWMGFWKEKVVCFCRNTVIRMVGLKDTLDQWVPIIYTPPPVIDIPFPQKCHMVNFADYGYLTLTNAFLFWSSTIILFSADHRMWISIDSCSYFCYELLEPLQCSVQTVALKAGIFVLGLETGVVIGFKIQHPLDLLWLDLYNPAFRSKLSVATIIDLDIGDINGEPVIVACTTESIISVSWKTYKLHDNDLDSF